MPDIDRYLRRFRRMVSPPGRPGPTAVPADRETELATELAPLFASIDDIDAEAARIGEDADVEVEEIEGESRERSQEILSRGREQAAVARADAIAGQRREANEDIRHLSEDAQQEAERIRRVGSSRIPGLVEEILARIEREAADMERA